jgi:hypothetical protein
VAASGAKDVPLVSHASRVAVPTIEQRRAPSMTTAAVAAVYIPTANTSSPATTSKPAPKILNTPQVDNGKSGGPTNDKITADMEKLDLSSPKTTDLPMPSLVVNGSTASPDDGQTKIDAGPVGSDDTSQRADSSSEIGTKAPSLDEKSITSGTTFALDEKESLRPDDSASVKAAAEDDEAFSIRGSQMATSRIGSDVARVHRLRIGDMPERRIVRGLPESSDVGILTPQSGVSGPQPPADKPQVMGTSAANTPDAFSSMYAQNPDEKLLEAMASPKDRLFLLRLEHDVINFVQSST